MRRLIWAIAGEVVVAVLVHYAVTLTLAVFAPQ